MHNNILKFFNKKSNFLLIVPVLLFMLLLFKDPFSDRTLIPNFDPYPDTFHYINPSLNLVKGDGFNLNREGRKFALSVPPVYSFTLIPFFAFNHDPRMAYFANASLALISLLLFWLILGKIFTNRVIRYLLLFLYITNYFIYWVPSLVMAENLTMTLYLAALYFLFSKMTFFNSFVVAFLAVGLYATKFANIPTTGTIVLLFAAKVLFKATDRPISQKIKAFFIFLISFLAAYLIFAVFEQATQGNNIFIQIYEHLTSVYKSVPKSISESKSTIPSWFGFQYISHNLPAYLRSLIGQPNRFLWDYTPIVPAFAGIGAVLGILTGLFNKKYQFIAISLLLLVATAVGFMSTFYSFDARYIYIAIPSLLIGLGLLLICIKDKIGLHRNVVFNFLIIIFIGIYLISSFSRIKSQISLNLKYAETPWNYVAVLKTNEYFRSEKIINNKKPILISALPPFLIDYYTNNNYSLLPLSYEQEFRSMKELVWGPNDYSNLPKLYKKYLNEGYDVYVSRAGLGNEGYTNRDFNTIVKEFDTKLVQPGCYDQCNIYSVKLKDKNVD